MKRTAFFIAIIFFLIPFFAACEGKNDENGELFDPTAKFDEFYTARQIVCWQDAAAVFLSKRTLSDYKYENALEQPETLEEKCGYLITVSLLARQGVDIKKSSPEQYIEEIKTAAESSFDQLTVKELALCFFALTAADAEFDYRAAAEYLESMQNNDGGFPYSTDYNISDAESSAYALQIISLSRRYITDDCHDGVLVYLGNAINEDNTLSDIESKKSAFTTALTLNALISAALPLNGEVSTALTSAINRDFLVTSGDALSGYKRYKTDTYIDREVTGEVMLCLAATAYGNLWTSLRDDKNA